jgi:hypothetical protein
MKKLRITKLDAATRQLNTAITLWFHDGDVVAIHTLASAAHQVIYDLVKKKTGPEMLFDSLVFRDEYRAKANRLLRTPQNFFKHADSDPDGEIEFRSDLVELFFLFSLVGLEFLRVSYDDIRSCFAHWFAVEHPELLTKKGKIRYAGSLPEGSLGSISQLTKAEFFELYRSIYQRKNS